MIAADNRLKILSEVIPTSRLRDAIPHRPPMIWIDEVVGVYKTGGGIARVVHQTDATYNDLAGNPREVAFIEWMAQAFGYTEAVRTTLGTEFFGESTEQRGPVQKAFLAQVRKVILNSVDQPARNYLVDVSCIKELGPVSLLAGRVINEETEEVLATAELKVFVERGPG